MSFLVRKEITFSPQVSAEVFECLIVAGAPATGLFNNTTFRDGNALQTSLQRLRDMWQRADALYVPRFDLLSLHQMECCSLGFPETPIPDKIMSDVRKLARYYVYLLFRYCMSAAGPLIPCNQQGFRLSFLVSQQGKKANSTALLLDIPEYWLQMKVCTNFPSAPPFPESDCASGRYRVPHQQPLPFAEYPQETKDLQQHSKRNQQLLDLKNKTLYPNLPQMQISKSDVEVKSFKRTENKRRLPECYDSNLESDGE